MLQRKEVRGVDLSMASTILRFRNPNVFQIIDKQAYRAIYDEKYPLNSLSPIHKKVTIYFEYIDMLIELYEKENLVFQTLDRLLYVSDKEINKKL